MAENDDDIIEYRDENPADLAEALEQDEEEKEKEEKEKKEEEEEKENSDENEQPEANVSPSYNPNGEQRGNVPFTPRSNVSEPTGFLGTPARSNSHEMTQEEQPPRNALHLLADKTNPNDFVAANEQAKTIMAEHPQYINARSNDQYGVSPLMCAVNKGNTGMMDALIEKGADLNMRNNCGETALMYAAYHGDVAMMKKLIEKGANFSIKAGENSNFAGMDIFGILEANGHADMIKQVAGFAKQKMTNDMRSMQSERDALLNQTQNPQSSVNENQKGRENSHNPQQEPEQKSDWHDKSLWDRVGVKNNEGGIDAGYRINMTKMSEDERKNMIKNFQEMGIKGELRSSTIDTEHVKAGELSYRITDPKSVEALEKNIFKTKENALSDIKQVEKQGSELSQGVKKPTIPKNPLGKSVGEPKNKEVGKPKIPVRSLLEMGKTDNAKRAANMSVKPPKIPSYSFTKNTSNQNITVAGILKNKGR